MTLDQYLELYPDHTTQYGNDFATQPPVWEVASTMVLFNEETACQWGGPYPGNYAIAMIKDYRLDLGYRLLPEQLLREQLWESMQKNWVKYNTKLKNPPKNASEIRLEYPTVECPIALIFQGNDDTSYTKWFATTEEAIELLELIQSAEPVDFFKDFIVWGFVFTN